MADKEEQAPKVETAPDTAEAHPVINDVEGTPEEESALNEILDIKPAPVSEPLETDSDGASKDAPPEESAPKAEEAEQTVQPDAPPELEKAIQALRRDNVPSELLEKLTNEQVMEWGEKAGKRQADNDEQFRQLRADKTESDTSEAKAEVQPSQEESQPEAQPDLDKSLQPVIDAMGLIDDEAEGLKTAFKSVTTPLQNTITEQREHLETQGSQIAQLTSLVLAGRMTDQYPQLTEMDNVASVAEKAGQLAAGGGYGNFADAFADAARTMYAGSTKEVSKNMEKMHKARNLGTVETQSTIEKDHYESLRDAPQEEKDDAMLDLILDGKSPAEVEEARRAIRA